MTVKIIDCKWADWCPKSCTNRKIKQTVKWDGYGSYTIEEPIECNLDTCEYYHITCDRMAMKRRTDG